MLRRLYVDNYRCLVNFAIEFQSLTLLAGPNGSGKSSVLDVMLGLRQLLSGTAKVSDRSVFPTASLTRWQDRSLQVFEVSVVLEDEHDLTYRIEVEHEKDTRRARIVRESLKAGQDALFESHGGEVQVYRDNGSKGPSYSADWSESALARVAPRRDNRRLTHFLDFIRGVSVCALDPKRFMAESIAEDSVLQPDGANFAAWSRHHIQERPDRMQRVVDVLRKVLDGFDSIRMEKVGAEARALIAMFRGEPTAYELRLDELSDGQRVLIALYALVYLAGDQDVLLLDEPDNYLALAEIQPWLMALSDECGARPRQAIICSHHPEMLDYLGSEAGVLLKRETSGVISVRSLQEAIGRQSESGLKLSEIVARGWEL